ncbi:MAG TPA: immunoglobulin-like domain-containing protein [Methylomirabilota bacterium]|nr:immunoglobulin-like domain-containing protein [Methylomirabilota bacterium]
MALSCAALHADTVVLVPGYVQGSVTIDGVTVQQGTVYASGAVQGSGTINGDGSYSVTLPGGNTYNLSFYAYGNDSQYHFSDSASITVPQGETVIRNLHRSTAEITGNIAVTAGEVVGHTINIWASDGVSSFSTHHNGNSALVNLRTLAASSIQIAGQVSVRTSSGAVLNLPLNSQSVAINDGAGVANWTVQVDESTGNVAGTVNLTSSGEPGAPVVQAVYISVGASGTSRSTVLYENGAYNVTDLPAGWASMYAYAYLNEPFQYLQLPNVNQSFYLQAGQTHEQNFVFPLSVINATVNISGFGASLPTGSSYITAYGMWGTASENAYAQDSAYGSTSFKLAVTPGNWGVYHGSIHFNQPNESAGFLNSQIYFNDYSRAPGQPGSVNTVGFETVNSPDFNIDTTVGEIIFDVVEPAGATQETVIQYAHISGWSQSGEMSYSIQANSPWADQAKPKVRFVAPPGDYTFQAQGYVNGSWTTFGSFNLNLQPPVQTPVGNNVTVPASDDVSVTFNNVSQSGVTTASQPPVGPAVSEDYELLTLNGSSAYLSVSSTAQTSGDVTLTFDYTGINVDESDESSLTVIQYGADGEWTELSGSVNTENNTITVTAPSLGLFALVLPNAPANEAPVANAGADSTIAANANCEAQIELDASASTDADGDTLTYTWTGAFGSVQGAQPTVALGIGSHELTLTVDDGNGGVSSDTVSITVVDQTAPAVALNGATHLTVECHTAYAELGASATDNCSGDLTGAIQVTGSVDANTPGVYTVTYTAADAAGNIGTATRTVTVVDTTSPVISAAAPSVAVLWAPDHKLVPVTISATVADSCDSTASVKIIGVTCNEPSNGLGDGNTAADWIITGDLSLQLRAERSGKGSDRIYTITIQATDAAQNSSTSTVTVRVPKSQSKK